jgi:hypothetical protein
MPFYEAFSKALKSMGIPEEVGNFIVRGNKVVHGEWGSTQEYLGVPDSIIEFQTALRRPQLWCAEVVFSWQESEEDAMLKLQRIATNSPTILGVTLLNIVESQQYLSPSKTSDTFTQLEKKTSIIPREKWMRKSNKQSLDSVIAYGHSWVSPLSITITTWLRNPNGKFNLNEHNAECYASAVSHCLFPPPSSLICYPAATMPYK